MRPAVQRLRPCLRSAAPFRRRTFSTETASHPSNKTQIYVSRCRDPLLNLSVEHHLLQVTPSDSTVLVLYVNAPSVVFGRNQNPWLETNLARLAGIARRPGESGWRDEQVRLVRRRSGGGTVFHDGGNVNFGVICPPAVFDRDTHAEMVVRALFALGRPTTRVNARHDIVVDAPATGNDQGGTFKVSGSAYKLTRLRSLHHGTCLLRSPNLASISDLLRSPAEPFIKARGVDSVRSPVRNLDLDNADFEDAVVEQFRAMYGEAQVFEEFDADALSVDKVRAGYEELQSQKWTYGQTPHFSFSTRPHDQDPRPRPPLPFDVRFEARHGLLEHFEMQGARVDAELLVGRHLHEISDWTARLGEAGLSVADAAQVGSWMNEVLGTEFTSEAQSSWTAGYT
ncbi:hypothetical protein HIM_06247 [Hirsutella minnesotensis 3608]|uniref:Putative lipoate-protein ligase A n=1 Tax=Hirsutella minnesotensis 3608 TaxID=1043627 RepID=A0A0F7ZZL6_9HYPO|nr:hypothetical protein HIM_06247 [Hirsutella minnesotensis 3608]